MSRVHSGITWMEMLEMWVTEGGFHSEKLWSGMEWRNSPSFINASPGEIQTPHWTTAFWLNGLTPESRKHADPSSVSIINVAVTHLVGFFFWFFFAWSLIPSWNITLGVCVQDCCLSGVCSLPASCCFLLEDCTLIVQPCFLVIMRRIFTLQEHLGLCDGIYYYYYYYLRMSLPKSTAGSGVRHDLAYTVFHIQYGRICRQWLCSDGGLTQMQADTARWRFFHPVMNLFCPTQFKQVWNLWDSLFCWMLLWTKAWNSQLLCPWCHFSACS